MSSSIEKSWHVAYLRAALETDVQKMAGRLLAARDAVAGRLKNLEGNSDHHAERHEMQSALAALNCLENEVRIWPRAEAIRSNRGAEEVG